jgi:hypothetical protein
MLMQNQKNALFSAGAPTLWPFIYFDERTVIADAVTDINVAKC